MSGTLAQAIAAIKAGDKQTGRYLLATALQSNPSDDQVWVWMSAVVDTNAQRRECLERALSINPNNATARQGLSRLDQATTLPPSPLVPPPPLATPTAGDGRARPDGQVLTPPTLTGPTTEETQSAAPAPLLDLDKTDRLIDGLSPADFVVREVSRNRRHSDIILELCRELNCPWDAADKFIRRIELQQGKRITARRSPLLLIIGVGTIVGGLAWGGYGLYELLNGTLLLRIGFFFDVVYLPTPVIILTGLAMIGGGAWGILRTIGKLTRK